jgi:hypothetical protein
VPKHATVILKWVAVTMIGIAIIGGAYYFTTHRSDVARQITLATTHQPEPITELYFADPEVLPASIPTAPSQLPVEFVIRNQESKTLDYTYRISFSDASGAAVTTADGKVSLKDGQSQSITQIIAVPSGQGRGAISVQLLNKSQQIHYWLERL